MMLKMMQFWLRCLKLSYRSSGRRIAGILLIYINQITGNVNEITHNLLWTDSFQVGLTSLWFTYHLCSLCEEEKNHQDQNNNFSLAAVENAGLSLAFVKVKTEVFLTILFLGRWVMIAKIVFAAYIEPWKLLFTQH